MSRDKALAADILLAARQALSFIKGMTREEFFRDSKTQAAVLMELIVIGEAVKGLSDEFRGALPDIPWKKVAGMRDRLIHDYRNWDLEEIWRTIQDRLPELIQILEKNVGEN
jgi:uncharacterized protein with HEPN domain